MTKYGVADLSVIAMRCEKSERSEMVSQLLFGEVYKVLEWDDSWIYIELLHDKYRGWIDRKMYVDFPQESLTLKNELYCTTELFNLVSEENMFGTKLVVLGSQFHQFNASNKSFILGKNRYTVESTFKDIHDASIRDRIIHLAFLYYNTPYLWGGRTPYGIDCSGLTQMVYRMIGVSIPRDAYQQAQVGENLTFLEESQPGDLAFFANDKGAISHVGIVWKDGRIIHASGKVRVDKLDHQGIYNEELKRYTHELKLLRKIL